MKIFFFISTKTNFVFFCSLPCSRWLVWNLIVVLFIQKGGALKNGYSAVPYEKSQMGALIPFNNASFVTWV